MASGRPPAQGRRQHLLDKGLEHRGAGGGGPPHAAGRMGTPAATLMQATTPSRASAPRTVSRCQGPQGTAPGARLPFAAPRAWVRVNRVSRPLASRKMRRLGSTAASSARRATPRARRRGRAGPAPPRGGFFAHQPPPLERLAQGRGAHPHPGALGQPVGVLGQGQSVRRRHPSAQRIQNLAVQPRRRAARVLRLRGAPTLKARLLLPAAERCLAHSKQRPDPPTAQSATLAGTQRPLAQVRRVRSWHGPASHKPPLNGPSPIRRPTQCKSALDGSAPLSHFAWNPPAQS